MLVWSYISGLPKVGGERGWGGGEGVAFTSNLMHLPYYLETIIQDTCTIVIRQGVSYKLEQ